MKKRYNHMNFRLWRPVARRRVAPPRHMVTAGFLSLALIVGALIASIVFTRPVAAASRQPQVAPANGTPRLEVLTIVGGQVKHAWSDDSGATWSGLENVGTPDNGHTFVGTPAAVSDGTGHLTVFARQDDLIWQNTFINNDPSSNWLRVPGQASYGVDGVIAIGCNRVLSTTCLYNLISDPAVTSWGAGRIDLFAYAQRYDGVTALIHTWADDDHWSGNWQVVGTGSMQGTPTAVSWGPGRIDVFARGGNNELEHRWLVNGNNWSQSWENLGGTLASNPSVTSPGSGQLNVFARGTDGHLWMDAGTSSTGWSGWNDVGNGCCLAGDVQSSVAAVSAGVGTLDVFMLSTNPNHALYSRADNLTSGWAGWQLITSPTTYTNLAVAEWFLAAPPPPSPAPSTSPTPSPTPGLSPTPCLHPPCTSTP